MTDAIQKVRTVLADCLEQAERTSRRNDPSWDGSYHPQSPMGDLHAAIAALNHIAANYLDLDAIPEGWRLDTIELPRKNAPFFVRIAQIDNPRWAYAEGQDFTLAAALAAAIERAKA